MSGFCQKCNTSSIQANFCPECGQKTIEKIKGLCGCGYQNLGEAKFCGNCGKNQTTTSSAASTSYSEPSFRPSAVKSGAVQTTGFQEYQRVSGTQTDDDERLEAQKRELERMNKKLDNFNPPSGGVVYGGLQGAYTQPQVQQPVQQQPVTRSPSVPLYQPVKQQPSSQPTQKSSFQITEEIVEEIVAPIKKGPGSAFNYEVMGDPNASVDNPRMESKQMTSTILFTPVPGRQSFRCECIVEGNTGLKFKLQTTSGGLLVKNFTMPFDFTQKNMRQVGTSIELDPF